MAWFVYWISKIIVCSEDYAKKNNLEILVDRSLNRFKDLYAAAGHPNCIFKINFDDLIKITNGSIEDIIE